MKTIWITIFTTILSVAVTLILQENYQEWFPVNGIVYQLLSSPNKYAIFAFFILLGLSPLLLNMVDKYILLTSKSFIRSFYIFHSGNFFAPVMCVFSFALVCLSFGSLLQAYSTHGWVIVRDHRYAEELQRQRLILLGNEAVKEGNLEKGIKYYQLILDHKIDTKIGYDYELQNHIDEILLAEKYWNDKIKKVDEFVQTKSLYHASSELYKARKTWVYGKENNRLTNSVMSLASSKKDKIEQGINLCLDNNESTQLFFMENASVFTDISSDDMKFYGFGGKDKPIMATKVLDGICSRLIHYTYPDAYIKALVSGEMFELYLGDYDE